MTKNSYCLKHAGKRGFLSYLAQFLNFYEYFCIESEVKTREQMYIPGLETKLAPILITGNEKDQKSKIRL